MSQNIPNETETNEIENEFFTYIEKFGPSEQINMINVRLAELDSLPEKFRAGHTKFIVSITAKRNDLQDKLLKN